jgi:hypothetical protein
MQPIRIMSWIAMLYKVRRRPFALILPDEQPHAPLGRPAGALARGSGMSPSIRWLLAATAMLAPMSLQAAETARVFKTSGCGCCLGWIRHLEENGYTVEATNMAMGSLMKMKLDAGLKVGQTSCHSAIIGGYFIEGHVPAGDIARLVAEKPDAVGLTVPDMPLGSPGMDGGDDREAYDVLLVRRNGATEVFAQH